MSSTGRPGRQHGLRGPRSTRARAVDGRERCVWVPVGAARPFAWLAISAGGQQRIIDALLAIASREGVTVRCDAHVERVIVRRGRAAGVALRGGEKMTARDVVTTISARPLGELLPAEALPDRLLRRLRIWRYSTAAFKLDYALGRPVPWTAEPARRAAVIHVGGELCELGAAAAAGQRGDMPERPAVVVGQHTLFDPSRAPAGQHTLYCYAHVPARYTCSDEDVVGLVEAQLERFAPGFADTVVARAIRNPQQTEAGESQPRRRRSRWRDIRTRPAARLPSSPRSCAGIAPRCAACIWPERRFIPAARSRAWAAARPPGRCWRIASFVRGGPEHPVRPCPWRRSRSGLHDAGLADPLQPPQRLDVAVVHERVGQPVERQL